MVQSQSHIMMVDLHIGQTRGPPVLHKMVQYSLINISNMNWILSWDMPSEMFKRNIQNKEV